LTHTDAGGSVDISLTADQDVARVAVADGCGGIPASELDRLFEPGWRGTSARTPAAGVGAGLGLAVARGIARAHGGDVTVANAGPGCRFELTLPLTEPTPGGHP
jgi:signal transduction histidine kinase